MPLSINDAERDRRFAVGAFAELSLGLIAIVLGWLLGPDARQHIPRFQDGAGVMFGLGIGTVAGVALAGGMGLVRFLPIRAISELNQFAEQHLWELLAPFSVPQLIVLAMTAGLGEELLFRGWLQSALIGSGDATLSQVALGLILASALFGLAHPISRAYVILAGFMGLALGLLYWCTGNLLTAITAHAVYDAIVIMLWRREMILKRTKL